MTTLPDEALDGPWKLPGSETEATALACDWPACAVHHPCTKDCKRFPNSVRVEALGPDPNATSDRETLMRALMNNEPLNVNQRSALYAALAAQPAAEARSCDYNGGTCTRRGCAAGCQAKRLMDSAAEARPVRNRDADRERFTDPEFNRWLDEGISDAGHTVWDAVGDVQAAWQGWDNRQLYAAPPASSVKESLTVARPVAPAGWLPIETAPMAVLVLVAVVDAAGERRVFVAETSHEGGKWRWWSTVCALGWGHLHAAWTPTHWMPLPPPPGASPAAPAPVAPAELRGLDTSERVRFYEHDFYVLSNFSAFSIKWQGRRFPTSEHAYHWEKFAPGTKEEHGLYVRDHILMAESAHAAFKMAEAWKPLRRPDWDSVKVDIMRGILRAKVAQHEYVRRKLLATGDRELVEDSWRDDFWGWGPSRDGKNMLGRLWMEVRAELRAHGISAEG